MNDNLRRLTSFRIIPVIEVDNTDAAIPLAEALCAGGLPVAEITYRTPVAGAVIARIRKERPDVLVGAGTLISVDNVKSAIDSGAAFGVAPGFNPEIYAHAVERGFSFIPGVMTPTEIEAAITKGVEILKFFPAEAVGGIPMLTKLTRPYSHTGVRFIPTGGIGETQLGDYLRTDMVVAVGGTWIATRDDISNKRWELIRNNCRRCLQWSSRFKTEGSEN